MSRTTEAPVLPPSHPLRTALTRYGRCAARNILATLLVSVAVASMLIYPFPFLYTTDFTIAAPNLPLHVWTDAHPLGDKPLDEADVIMRSIWIHGSYMKALDRQVLLGALELQDEILGPTTNFDPRRHGTKVASFDLGLNLSREERDSLHVANGLTNHSWFFHSPLQYWACDVEQIKRDKDFLSTVNAKKTQPTSVNVTLRHSIVFSGKNFEDRQLVAADALVITLLHLRDSPVGRQWERRTEDFAARMAHKWDVFPKDGVPTGSQLYEFQFRPISTQDTVVLSLAYVLTAGYFLLSLSKIRAVKSKLGLMVTVVVQIAMAIVSSLTVCALCRIDLSRIPRASYPLVLMAMSLENVFRLINAVILTPADHSTSSRIGLAFGETGHIALASVAQNLLILWGLSTVVVSGVSAFCTFAAIAILFDFFYLSTFFLSVLSVDVRRTELNEALEKAAIRQNRPSLDSLPRQSLMDAFLQGRIALSTRLAGTFVMLGFVLMAQWHFFDSASRSPLRLLRFLWKGQTAITSPSTPYAGLHQARSPKSWLRLQDHETAKEVINVVKPWAHSYVARVYDPVVFVLKGSDRNPPGVKRWFPDVAYDFAHHQLVPFFVAVLFVVACVRLLMNYLLWDEMADARGEDDYDEEPLISIKSLEHGHELDIVKMAVAPDGQIISAALDRKIRMWNLRFEFASYVLARPRSPVDDPFPILAMAVDEESARLAILTTYRVLIWSITDQQWGPSAAVDLGGQKPEAFFFAGKRKALRSVVIVRRNGTLSEVWPGAQETHEHYISKSPLLCVAAVAEKSTAIHPEPRLSLVTLSRHACIHRVSLYQGHWVNSEVTLATKNDKHPHSLLSVQGFSAYLVVRPQSVDLVDLHSSKIMHTFMTAPMQPRSLKFVYSGRRLEPGGRGTVSSLTLAYNSQGSGDCVLQTYLPGDNFDNICFSNANGPPRRSSCPWNETRQITRRISEPGSWSPLRNGSFVGVRRVQEPLRNGSHMRDRLPAFAQSGLRRRGGQAEAPPTKQSWEVWVMTRLEREGNIEIKPCDTSQDSAGLIISELGPMVKVGHGSVAVGFGNIIKVVTVGHEWFDNVEEESFKPEPALMATRRKRVAASRTRAVSTTFRYPDDT